MILQALKPSQNTQQSRYQIPPPYLSQQHKYLVNMNARRNKRQPASSFVSRHLPSTRQQEKQKANGCPDSLTKLEDRGREGRHPVIPRHLQLPNTLLREGSSAAKTTSYYRHQPNTPQGCLHKVQSLLAPLNKITQLALQYSGSAPGHTQSLYWWQYLAVQWFTVHFHKMIVQNERLDGVPISHLLTL